VVVELQAQDAAAAVVTLRDAVAGPVLLETVATLATAYLLGAEAAVPQ